MSTISDGFNHRIKITSPPIVILAMFAPEIVRRGRRLGLNGPHLKNTN